MARPPSISDETLLKAAHAVLKERGASASTIEIAERAGVSEGTLFHRFGSRHGLMNAVLSSLSSPWLQALPGRVGEGEVFEQLRVLAHETLGFFRELMPLTMIAMSSQGQQGPEALAERAAGKLRGERIVAQYLDAEMRLGRLRRLDAEVVAMAFLGALHSFAMNEYILRNHRTFSIPEHTFVRGLIETLQSGIGPESPPGPPANARPRRRSAT
ncbi:MAG: TetR/AcrR family transcriptional regulator [Deltaproteobacteria bacterium]|nr:TetR/AcrR family transcriptional regulator [Deltaproteobacteria bacterium]